MDALLHGSPSFRIRSLKRNFVGLDTGLNFFLLPFGLGATLRLLSLVVAISSLVGVGFYCGTLDSLDTALPLFFKLRLLLTAVHFPVGICLIFPDFLRLFAQAAPCSAGNFLRCLNQVESSEMLVQSLLLECGRERIPLLLGEEKESGGRFATRNGLSILRRYETFVKRSGFLRVSLFAVGARRLGLLSALLGPRRGSRTLPCRLGRPFSLILTAVFGICERLATLRKVVGKKGDRESPALIFDVTQRVCSERLEPYRDIVERIELLALTTAMVIETASAKGGGAKSMALEHPPVLLGQNLLDAAFGEVGKLNGDGSVPAQDLLVAVSGGEMKERAAAVLIPA